MTPKDHHIESSDDDICSRCGRVREYWSANDGQGQETMTGIYCCDGCAEGGLCTCDIANHAVRIARMEEDRRPTRRKRSRPSFSNRESD